MSILRACVVCGKPSARSYCAEHKPKPWARSKRRSRVTLSGSAEQKRRERVLHRYLFCCHVCGKPGADQVDHVVPLGEGGADDESNLAPIHAEPCHREKTAAEAQRARHRGGDGPRTGARQGSLGGAIRARSDPDRSSP